MIEELKMVLELVRDLGGDAKAIIIAWLCIRAFAVGCGYGLGLFGAIMAAKLLNKLVEMWKNQLFEGRLAEALGESYLYQSHKHHILRLIEKDRMESET